jgi:CMP-N-acetylneuraminic acid synthetase/spore coat polysaccharide biosynthesis predicted glycosyltransferase SpsG
MIRDKKIVAVIPARGGSKGIPRKNARLLAGKPLISYAIKTCLDSRYIDSVFVTTDCPNLKEISLKFGAYTIDRDPKLAEDNVGLDEVIVDAVERLEEEKNLFFDIIVSVQATSPLISNKSIDTAIEQCIEKDLDTVVSVVNDNHLQWGFDNKQEVIPFFQERKNRQYLAGRYKETGGFVVCKRDIINTNTRFGENVNLFKVSKEESVDVDDRFDWWLAEKTLLRKRICFYVIGSKMDGLGHVYRALSIADRIMDHEICFVTNKESDLAIKKIESQLYNLTVCKKGDELETILKLEPSLVINDILNTERKFVKTLKEKGLSVINFEDLGEGSLYADVVINSLYDYYPYPKNGKVFSGSEYCCLRDEFLYTKPKVYSDEVNNIFILIGATDPESITMQMLKWLDEMGQSWTITVILGLGDLKADAIMNYSENAKTKIDVIRDTNIVSKYMREADIAITAAGRTIFELTSLGVPMISIASNERELTHSLIHKSFGVISLGLWNEVGRDKFHDAIWELVNSTLLRKKMHRALLENNLGMGIENVLALIHDTLIQNVANDNSGTDNGTTK